MAVHLSGSADVLFQGDSITAAGRELGDDTDLGHGFVRLVADSLATSQPTSQVHNRGVGGDRASDLLQRWSRDTLALRPAVLSVLVGINDTWRRYERGEETSSQAYEDTYRELLRQSAVQGTRFVLIEPFLIPVHPEQWARREDLDQRIQVVRRLAEEFDASLLAADGLLHQAARELGDPRAITDDGVHLTAEGHGVLARAWLRLVG
ncbi:SGNH/GDSL hydrolase family protein [Streptomyces sp. NPDC048305]|uniref:SGNH/GDSL hydrolase family protein n=1 Tax=Streptomyces sp. NPDC048305 TaxID=3365532 RepID=UPI003710D42D